MATPVSSSETQADAVVGSIIFRASVTLVAGNPLSSACLWITSPSLA